MLLRPIHRSLLGLGALLPILAMAAVATYGSVFLRHGDPPSYLPFIPFMLANTAVIMFATLTTIAVMFGHLLGSAEAPKEKALWGAALLFFHAFATPVYWWRFVRRAAPSTGPQLGQPSAS